MPPVKVPQSNSPFNDPDITLMLRFQKGEEAALEELVHKYEKSALNTIYRYTGDRVSAEDLAQEVFLRVFKSRRDYRPTRPFRYWFFSILTNLCLNYIRDRKRHKIVSLFQDEENPQLNIKDEKNKTISSQFKNLELQVAVRQAIKELQPKQRMAVLLCKYEEYSYDEIAEVMKISVSAVKSLLFRARETLKEKLSRYVT